MTKILLTVKGGVITSICSTEEISVIIVDYDNIEAGADPVGEVIENDCIFKDTEAYQMFTDESEIEDIEIRNELKRIHF